MGRKGSKKKQQTNPYAMLLFGVYNILNDLQINSATVLLVMSGKTKELN